VSQAQHVVEASSSIRTEAIEFCLLCGSPGALLYSGLTDRLYGVTGTWTFESCRRCGFIWLNPRPVSEDLSRCYPDYGPHRVRATTLAARRRPLRDSIRTAVLHAHFGYPAPGKSISRKLLGRAAARIPFLRHGATYGLDELLPPYRANGRLLDVGCGAGTYLSQMKQLGWEVLGVDTSHEAAKTAKAMYGIDVLVGDVESVDITQASMDVIVMTHAIEHVENPVAVLARCRELLGPSGRIILTTPNVKSLGHRLFGRDWLALDPPRHLSLFSRASLKRCVQLAGLRVSHARTRASMVETNFEMSWKIRTTGSATSDSKPMPRRMAALAGAERQLLSVAPDLGEEIILVATL
jgi:2-polyprenyl-3-methyl-5-hydroxy-6-metoxy-1,4-benzoquinol methylase